MDIKEEEVVYRNSPFNFHTCDLCIFRTKSLRVILSHIKKHQQESKLDRFSCQSANLEPLECQFCYFKDNLKIVLDRHVNQTHGEVQNPDTEIQLKSYICDKCFFETYSLLVFVRHVCDDSQLFASITENETVLKFSAREGASLSRFQCEECTFKTRCKHVLKNHVSLVNQTHGEVQNPGPEIQLKSYICGKCDFETCSLLMFVGHVCADSQLSASITENETVLTFSATEGASLSRFQCEECTFKTRCEHVLTIHVSLKQDDKWFKCNKCSFQTKWRQYLKQHTLIKHTDPEKVKWIKCEHCSYKTFYKLHLKQHILSKHTSPEEVKWFECEHCSYKTKHKFSLNRHSLNRHSSPNEVKWFQCEHCSYKTKHKKDLKRHSLNVHSNPQEVKWFQCEHCTVKTKHRNNLTKHILSKHLGLKKVEWFECEHCSFKTKYKWDLTRHNLRKHNN